VTERTNMSFIALIVAVATIGGFLFGFDSGVVNGTVDGLSAAFHSQDVGTGFNVSSILLGCAAGAFAAGQLADVFGRKAVLICAAVLFIAGAWGSGAANTSAAFVAARLVAGLAIGAASVLAPAYISEVAPANIRGRLASVQQIMIVVGLTAAFLSNFLLAHAAGKSTEPLWLNLPAWRWMYWMGMVPAAVFLISLLSIPESPRFLVAKGRRETAEGVLARLFGAGAAPAKADEIARTIAADHRPSLRDIVGGPVFKPIVWVGIGLAVFQQFVGINVIFYYGAVLWQAVGFGESDALTINIISGSLSIGSCLLAIALIDRIGRKPLLMIGSVGMAITLGLMAYAFSSGELVEGKLHLSPAMGLVALISGNAYSALFNFSWGPVMWVMLGEMFPNQMRGSALAVSGLAQWLANFLVTLTFPIMLTGIGLFRAYAIYAAFAVISAVFVAVAVRETRGLELEAMPG
jgi:MFS transporter, SP family, sugar:H+ symporter